MFAILVTLLGLPNRGIAGSRRACYKCRMKSRLTLPISCGVAIALFWAVAFSQSPPAASQPSALTLPFFALDEHKHPVSVITQADFSAFGDAKIPLTVLAVRNASEVPLRLGLLIDTSGSQKSSARYAEAMEKRQNFLLDVLSGPDDRAFIMAFSGNARFTEFLPRDQIPLAHLDTQPRGGTALYDAIVFACNRFMKDDPGKPIRRVLVLLTDGEDNASHVGMDEAVAAAESPGVVIFSLDTNESQNAIRGPKVLQSLSTQTGGESINLQDRGVKKALAEVEDQIGNMYGLTFTLPPGDAGRQHTFELKPLTGKKLKIRAPQGYYVP